jgi:hypothetical protein
MLPTFLLEKTVFITLPFHHVGSDWRWQARFSSVPTNQKTFTYGLLLPPIKSELELARLLSVVRAVVAKRGLFNLRPLETNLRAVAMGNMPSPPPCRLHLLVGSQEEPEAVMVKIFSPSRTAGMFSSEALKPSTPQ